MLSNNYLTYIFQIYKLIKFENHNTTHSISESEVLLYIVGI